MANVLHKFEQKTKILASQVNENFEFLQDDIGILSESIDSKLSSTKQDILSDIETVKESLENGKANKDLSNISDETVKKIVSYIMPDYTNEIIITKEETFTVPENGVLNYVPSSNTSTSNDINLQADGKVQINGKTVYQATHAQGHDAAHTEFFYALVGKDSTVYHTCSVGKLYFYPCKGKGDN